MRLPARARLHGAQGKGRGHLSEVLLHRCSVRERGGVKPCKLCRHHQPLPVELWLPSLLSTVLSTPHIPNVVAYAPPLPLYVVAAPIPTLHHTPAVQFHASWHATPLRHKPLHPLVVLPR